MLSLALVLAVGAGAPARPAAVPRRLTTCSVAAIRSPQVDARRRFSATRVIDLEFDVALSPKVGEAERLALKVFTPNGHLYETLAPQPAIPSAGHGTGRTRVIARLPVAGTPIVTSSLYGRWSVVPYLEGETDACGWPRAFWVDP
jgi:hypothetical protein